MNISTRSLRCVVYVKNEQTAELNTSWLFPECVLTLRHLRTECARCGTWRQQMPLSYDLIWINRKALLLLICGTIILPLSHLEVINMYVTCERSDSLWKNLHHASSSSFICAVSFSNTINQFPLSFAATLFTVSMDFHGGHTWAYKDFMTDFKA